MQFKQVKKLLIPLFLLIAILITRFCFLNWGNNNFFNPDENNMATAVAQMNFSNLNPNFFAYGQFPLFLTFFTSPSHNFPTIILTLRFWSALFSSLSILFFYLIIKDIFKSKKLSYIFVLLLIFTPGYIQAAHFGTTESILLFVFSANIFLSLKYFANQKKEYLLFSILISAIGLASKITAIFFVLPIYLSLLLIYLKKISRPVKGGVRRTEGLKLIFSLFVFTFLFLLLSILFSPFNLINFSEFKSSMLYESSVATGSLKVFYTHQFENSFPYLFQFKNIFPYTNGIFIFIFSFIGFFIALKSYILNHKSKLILILLPSLIYFLYAGQLFVKWTRFMSPIFFLGPFFCLFIFKKISESTSGGKNNFLTFILLILMISPGIYFFQNYFYKDSRVEASQWIQSNIPSESFILSESGNVINLPIANTKLKVNNFDFYNPENIKNLNTEIYKSNYIIIPSRRVFKNNFSEFNNYYQKLFSGDLAFKEIAVFKKHDDLFLKSENAEETWSVFDQPTIRIYEKVNNLTSDDYQALLKSN